MSGTPSFSQNQGSITVGTFNQTQNTMQSYNQSTGTFNQNQPAFSQNHGPMAGTTCNQKSRLETIPQGSIMNVQGTHPGSLNTIQAVAPYTPTNQYTNPGSITSGTPVHNQAQTAPANFENYSNYSSNTGSYSDMDFSSDYGTGYGAQNNYESNFDSSGTGFASAPNFQSAQSYGANFASVSGNFQNQSTPGSITAGTPMQTNFSGSNYGANQSSNSNFGINQSTGSNYGTSQSSNTNYGTSQSSNPNYGTNQSNSSNYGRQRKYSGPQRVKLQALATVQEMGKLFRYIWLR